MCAERLTACVTDRTSETRARIEAQRALERELAVPRWPVGMGVALMLGGGALGVWGALRQNGPDLPMVLVGAGAAASGGFVLLRF